jgi:hypothetical protein
MKKSQIILAAVFLAASGLLQAAGAVKTYLVETAFASDDAVGWTGMGATSPEENPLQVTHAFGEATSTTGSVVVRVGSGRQPLPTPSADGRLLTEVNGGPVTLTFTSGPVMGVGVRIWANEAGSFTGRMSVYDAAGKLVGTTSIAGATTAASTDSTSPFLGIRSSLKEIAKVEIDATSANGYTIGSLRVALRPIIENDAFFVNQQYQDFYGRAPSTIELTGHLNALKQGTTTRAQIARSLFQSPEFHDNAGFLVKCYMALIQRDPDFTQWSQILKLMQGGATQDNALAAFMNMSEYAAAYPESLNEGAFVTKLHRNLLGRDPASAELDSMTLKLTHGITRRDMVGGILKSHEFEQRIANRVNPSLAYLALLRRGGEPAGMNRWTSALNGSASVTDLVGAFIALPEYIARF